MLLQLKGVDGTIWFDDPLNPANKLAALNSHWFSVAKAIDIPDGYAVIVNKENEELLTDHIAQYSNLGIDEPGKFAQFHAINIQSAKRGIHCFYVFERADIAALFKLRWS